MGNTGGDTRAAPGRGQEPSTHSADRDVLTLRNVSKTFHGNTVLRGVDLDLRSGEVHSLVGMNGSGKSTLIKLLAGVYIADRGSEITLRESAVGSAAQPGRGRVRQAMSLSVAAQRPNIGFVHQDLGLIPEFTLLENFELTLGGSADRARGHESAQRVETALARVGVQASPYATVAQLGAADRSLFAIARALEQLRHTSRPILVLDEPTASLPKQESERVLRTMRQLVTQGAAVLFVSHHLSEVLSVSDRVTALRDGRVTLSAAREGLTEQLLVDAILGDQQSSLSPHERREHERGDRSPAVIVEAVTSHNVHGVSFEAYPGEVLVITGLVGCGKSQLGRILVGSHRAASGEVRYPGLAESPRSVSAAIDSRISYVPAERKTAGGIGDFTLEENVSLSSLRSMIRAGAIDARAERALAERFVELHQIRPPLPPQPFSMFSGGNQQKIVMARAMAIEPRVLVVDEPTQGVDVGAIALLYRRIESLSAAGATVIVITSSFEEAVALGDRAIVLDKGQMMGEISRADLSVESLVTLSLRGERSHAR